MSAIIRSFPLARRAGKLRAVAAGFEARQHERSRGRPYIERAVRDAGGQLHRAGVPAADVRKEIDAFLLALACRLAGRGLVLPPIRVDVAGVGRIEHAPTRSDGAA